MVKCITCGKDAVAQCQECGAFFCNEHGEWVEEQYEQGKWRRRQYCNECHEFFRKLRE